MRKDVGHVELWALEIVRPVESKINALLDRLWRLEEVGDIKDVIHLTEVE